MASLTVSRLSDWNALPVAEPEERAQFHPRPRADRTARGACEKRSAPDRPTTPSDSRRSGPDATWIFSAWPNASDL